MDSVLLSTIGKVKAVANEDSLWRNIAAHVVFLGEQMGKHLLLTQNVSGRNQKHFCVLNDCCARANREAVVSAIMCPQHCVLICQHLKESLRPSARPEYITA